MRLKLNFIEINNFIDKNENIYNKISEFLNNLKLLLNVCILSNNTVSSLIEYIENYINSYLYINFLDEKDIKLCYNVKISYVDIDGYNLNLNDIISDGLLKEDDKIK